MNPVVHFEMGYTDGARVSRFYTEVFGWQMTQLNEKMGNYVLVGTVTEVMDNPRIGEYASFRDPEGYSVGLLQPVTA